VDLAEQSLSAANLCDATGFSDERPPCQP